MTKQIGNSFKLSVALLAMAMAPTLALAQNSVAPATTYTFNTFAYPKAGGTSPSGISAGATRAKTFIAGGYVASFSEGYLLQLTGNTSNFKAVAFPGAGSGQQATAVTILVEGSCAW